jgi:hypothetical protein
MYLECGLKWAAFLSLANAVEGLAEQSAEPLKMQRDWRRAMQIDDVMALVDEYVSASIEDHGYRSGAASAEYLEDTKRKLLAAIESLISAPAAPQQAEPVGYFQRDCDYFEQVEDVYQWDADVIPLYLHPPAEPQQAEPAKPAPWPAEPDRRQPYLDLQSAWSCADQGTMAGSIIGRLVNELRILRERVDRAPVAAPQQAEPAIAIEVTQDADGTWSLTVPTYFPCMPVGKHDLYLHPPAAEVQRLRDALEDLLHHAETHRAEQVWVLRASEVADIARRALEGK